LIHISALSLLPSPLPLSPLLPHPTTMTVQVFSVPVFFVVFRETLETVIIVSVLLAFLKQTLDGPNADKKVYRKLVRQVDIFL
jgi:hypothetical protein